MATRPWNVRSFTLVWVFRQTGEISRAIGCESTHIARHEKADEAERRQAEAERKIADAEATARHARTDAIIAIREAVGFGLADYPRGKVLGLDSTVGVARSRIAAEADDVRRREQAVAERETKVREALAAVEEIPPAQPWQKKFVEWVKGHAPKIYTSAMTYVNDWREKREKRKTETRHKVRDMGRVDELRGRIDGNAPSEDRQYE